MVSRNEDHPDPDPDTILGVTLLGWGYHKPWHYTPPLLIQCTEDTDADGLVDWIEEEIGTHEQSEAEVIHYDTIVGLMISCEDIGKLSQHDGVKLIEIEGYGKTCSS